MADQIAEKFANDAWDLLCVAVVNFGIYTYQAKGAEKIMNLHPLIERVKSMGLQDAGESLSNLLQKQNEHFAADNLVSSILYAIQNETWFDDLLNQHEDLDECY